MNERGSDKSRNVFGAIVEADIKEEASEEKTKKAWEDLFTSIANCAKSINLPVDSLDATVDIKEDPSKEAKHRLIINPALTTPDGNLEIVVLDLMSPNGVTQWVGKAEWIKGKPKVLNPGKHVAGKPDPSFTSYSVAVYATTIINGFKDTPNQNPRNSFVTAVVMPMTESKHIN